MTANRTMPCTGWVFLLMLGLFLRVHRARNTGHILALLKSHRRLIGGKAKKHSKCDKDTTHGLLLNQIDTKSNGLLLPSPYMQSKR